MLDLLAALDASSRHRRCGNLDGGVEGGRVWMTCDCGAEMVGAVRPESSPLVEPA